MQDIDQQTTEACEDQEVKYRGVLLTVNDVEKYWPRLRVGIAMSIPPTVPAVEEVIANIQQAILAGRLSCWMMVKYTDANPDGEPALVATTTIVTDTMSGVKNLLIYTLTAFKLLPPHVWRLGKEYLMQWARKHGCMGIVGEAINDRSFKVAQRLGMKEISRQVFMEVKY